MRTRKIIPTKRICTATPNGELKPSYGIYSSITTTEKLQFEIATKQAIVEDKNNRRLNASFEKLCRKMTESRASQRIF